MEKGYSPGNQSRGCNPFRVLPPATQFFYPFRIKISSFQEFDLMSRTLEPGLQPFQGITAGYQILLSFQD